MNSTSSNSTCGDYFVLNTWLNYTLIASLPTIVLFCFLERRVNLWPAFLNGRPGIATPINLIDAYDGRLASALAFVCVSVMVFNKVSDDTQESIVSALQSSTDTVPEMLREVLWFLGVIWKALLVCTACYPIFLCLGTKHKVTGKAIGIFYSLLWTVFYVGRLARCTNGLLFKLSEQWISGPGCVCFLLLTFQFVHGLVKHLYRLHRHQLSSLEGHAGLSQDASSKFKESHFFQRTKYLLSRPRPKEYGGNFISRVFRKHFYYERGFKYSRQNISVLAMVLLLTYLTCTFSTNILVVFLSLLAKFALHLEVTFWLANFATIVICMLSNIDAQTRYREHTLQLWRGDRSFRTGIVLSNEAIMMNSTRYIGYRLAFAIIGYEVLLFVLWCCFELIEMYFVCILKKYWLLFVLFLVWNFAQILMNRLVFLQRADDEDPSRNIFRKRKTYLGLDNRRFFHVVFYFTLFVNIIRGAVACAFRVLRSVIIGVCLIGRVDRCALQRDWESHDNAFTAYISFLELEVSHTHPVVITFCHLLNESIAKRKPDTTSQPGPTENIYAMVNEVGEQADAVKADPPKVATEQLTKAKFHEAFFSQTDSKGPSPSGSCHPAVPTVDRVMSSRVRNRWFLALTLTRNPTLIPMRKKPKEEILSLLVQDN